MTLYGRIMDVETPLKRLNYIWKMFLKRNSLGCYLNEL